MSTPIEIKPIGVVLKTDKHGFLVSQSAAEKITEPWRSAASAVVDVARAVLGNDLHSVYVRGSASRGEAIEKVSDLDTMLVVKNYLSDKQIEKLRSSVHQLEQGYPFCTDIEANVRYLDRLLSGQDGNAVMLKIYAACIYGEDIIPQLPQVRPTRKLAHGLKHLREEISTKLHQFESGEKEFTEAWCRWMMKRILRAAGELIMEREQVFVRDLYPCYVLFSKYYPEQESNMRLILQYALDPTNNLEEIKDLLDEMSLWLHTEGDRVYGI